MDLSRLFTIVGGSNSHRIALEFRPGPTQRLMAMSGSRSAVYEPENKILNPAAAFFAPTLLGCNAEHAGHEYLSQTIVMDAVAP